MEHAVKHVHYRGAKITAECHCGFKTPAQKNETLARKKLDAHVALKEGK